MIQVFLYLNKLSMSGSNDTGAMYLNKPSMSVSIDQVLCI